MVLSTDAMSGTEIFAVKKRGTDHISCDEIFMFQRVGINIPVAVCKNIHAVIYHCAKIYQPSTLMYTHMYMHTHKIGSN